MYQCENCEKEFDTPMIIDDEIKCPYCKSEDVVGGEDVK